ncbi:MAG: ParB N-terminal domain-containing protein [Candidatus Caldarchaeum sp.]
MASGRRDGRAGLSLKPWTVTLARISWLKPHEQSIPPLTNRLAEEIRSTGRIIHPIIVDAGTGLVVDGTHRVEAAVKLGLKFLPAYLVDYNSDNVVLESWGRVVKKQADKRTVVQKALQAGFKISPAGMDVSEFTVKLVWPDGAITNLTLDEKNARKVYEAVSKLEHVLRELEISYVVERDVAPAVAAGQYSMGYLVRKLSKNEVLSLVKSGVRLPPKSTRHIVDRRPLYVFFPLNVLYGEDAPAMFDEWIRAGNWVELPQNLVLDRRYEERVVVYFREDLRSLYPEKLLDLLKTVKA